MRVIRPSVLSLALVIAAPALWQGFVDHGTDTGTALSRYLMAVPVAAVMVAVVGWLIELYQPQDAAEDGRTTVTVTAERRRAEDKEPPREPDAGDGAEAQTEHGSAHPQAQLSPLPAAPKSAPASSHGPAVGR